MEKNSAFGLGDATAVEHLEGGVTRKILKYGGKLMLVEIRGERMVRILRERYSGKVALATDDAPAKIYSERDVNVLGRVVLSISSF